MSRFLIDKTGDVFPAFDDRLMEKFGYPMPDFDLPSYAVRNLGAVDVEINESSAIVRFRWLTVSQEALEACIRLLLEMSTNEVTIFCQAEEWSEHKFATTGEAIDWLEENQSATFGVRRASPHFVVKPQGLKGIAERPLNRLEQPEDHFAFFFKKWRLAQGKFSPDVTDALVRFGDIDRVVIASERADGKLVFQHIGSRLAVYDRSDTSWTYRLVGSPISEQPDREYGKCVESLLRNSLMQGKPKLDHIDAVIQDGRGTVRFRYDRLSLPWNAGSKQRILTTLSFRTGAEEVVETASA